MTLLRFWGQLDVPPPLPPPLHKPMPCLNKTFGPKIFDGEGSGGSITWLTKKTATVQKLCNPPEYALDANFSQYTCSRESLIWKCVSEGNRSERELYIGFPIPQIPLRRVKACQDTTLEARVSRLQHTHKCRRKHSWKISCALTR